MTSYDTQALHRCPLYLAWLLQGVSAKRSLFGGLVQNKTKLAFLSFLCKKRSMFLGLFFGGLSAQLFGSSWWPLPPCSDWQLPSLSKRKGGGRGGIVNTRPIERFPQKERKTIMRLFRCQRILVRCQSLMLSYIWRMASRPQRPII